MSSPAKKSPDSGSQQRKKASPIDLGTARQMLPLVSSIVVDIVDHKKKMQALSREQTILEQERRNLSWEARSWRYAVTDELVQVERNLTTAVGELNELGVALVDPDSGTVDFPTKINGRPAAFIWEPGEEGLRFWHYAEEDQRRPIPSDWQSGNPLRGRSGS